MVSSGCALLLVFLSGIGYSVQTLIVKLLAEEGFHASFQLIFFRGVVQSLLSGAVMLYHRFGQEDASHHQLEERPKCCGDSWKATAILWARGLFGYGGIAFAFLSLQYIPIGDAVTLLMMSPFYSSFLSFLLLRESWLCVEYIATMISFVGVILVSRPPMILHALSIDAGEDSRSEHFHFGITCAIMAGICAGCAYTAIRILGTSHRMPWENVAFFQGLPQILLAYPSMQLVGQSMQLDISAYMWIVIVGVSLLGSCSQFAMTIGMQNEKSSRATVMRMSDIVCGFLWQSLFTSDAVNKYSLTGAVLISIGVLTVVFFKNNASNDEDESAIVNLMKQVELQVAESGKNQRYSQLQHEEVDLEEEEDDDLSALCMTDKELDFLQQLEGQEESESP